MVVHVSTVGVELPDDFPHAPYNAIHARVIASPRAPEQIFHYGGAWNAVAFRFLSLATADDLFTDSVIKSGSAPGYPERFQQEESLFNFFVNGLSVIESFFHGLYWIGSMGDRATFPIRSGSELRKIKTDTTIDLYMAKLGSTRLTNFFALLRVKDASGHWRNTSQYEEWKDVRNILAHRAAYGRVLTGSTRPGPQPEDVWRVRDIPLNDQLTRTRRAWMAATLKSLLEGAEEFAVGSL
jgi:hypothetical protein